MKPKVQRSSEFDHYAADYDAALEEGISVSGEGKDYFARNRVEWLERRLAELGIAPKKIMDYGCGTGSGTPFLRDAFSPEDFVGIDPSDASLEVARQNHGADNVRFSTLREYTPDGRFDLVFCNGVFHHIPPGGRPAAVDYVRRSLRPGGVFAFWENNPWNPGTRIVMKRIPFDRDAITLSVVEARGLLKEGGFRTVTTDFHFIFPRPLAWLRWLEPPLCRLPLGAQYLVLSVKPE